MTKEIIGFINKNNDVFNLKDDSSASKYCCKVGQGHENKIAAFTEDGDVKDSNKTIDDLITRIQPSADGNFASLDENGNLQDSGKKPADFVPNVPGATEGNLPNFDADGNLQDSGKNTDSFAQEGHSHSAILDTSTESSISIEEGRISIFIEGEGSDGETQINADNIGNLHRALVTPSSIPENDATKLITSKAVYDSLAVRAPYYRSSISIESDGNGNLQILQGGNIERDLNDFISNTEANKLYNIIIDFYKPNTYCHSYPAIAYWKISDQDDNIVLIYVGDYCFLASQAAGSSSWENEEFNKSKISSFLETF